MAAAWLTVRCPAEQEAAGALQGDAGGAGILGRKGRSGAVGAQSMGAALADGALSARPGHPANGPDPCGIAPWWSRSAGPPSEASLPCTACRQCAKWDAPARGAGAEARRRGQGHVARAGGAGGAGRAGASCAAGAQPGGRGEGPRAGRAAAQGGPPAAGSPTARPTATHGWGQARYK